MVLASRQRCVMLPESARSQAPCDGVVNAFYCAPSSMQRSYVAGRCKRNHAPVLKRRSHGAKGYVHALSCSSLLFRWRRCPGGESVGVSGRGHRAEEEQRGEGLVLDLAGHLLDMRSLLLSMRGAHRRIVGHHVAFRSTAKELKIALDGRVEEPSQSGALCFVQRVAICPQPWLCCWPNPRR